MGLRAKNSKKKTKTICETTRANTQSQKVQVKHMPNEKQLEENKNNAQNSKGRLLKPEKKTIPEQQPEQECQAPRASI